jgi:predicted dehydrogenase
MWTVGVIGTGSFGQKRLQALLELPDLVEYVVAYDRDSKKLSNIISGLKTDKVLQSASVEELLTNPSIQAVFICTPNFTHPELCRQALAHNKHVLCEKPITFQVKVARRLISLAQKKSLILKPGTNHRFFPSVQKLFSLVEEGKLGKILSFHGNIGTNGQRIQNSWFWKKEKVLGGTFFDNGHHLLDLALLLCGPFTECVGHTSKRLWTRSEVEDYAVAIYNRKSSGKDLGSEAVLRSSWRQPAGYLEIEVWGTKGFARLKAGSEEMLTWEINGVKETIDYSQLPKVSLEISLRHFFQLCENAKKKPKIESKHFLSLTQMIEAFYSSQKTKKWVKL